MKKWIALYIAGAILTNSYVRMHRLEAWKKQGVDELHEYNPYASSRDVTQCTVDANSFALLATTFWPIYTLGVGADTLVCTKVEIEK